MQIEKGAAIDDPDPRAIAEALKGLNERGNTFAIYVRGGSGGTYMQTLCVGANEYLLEYQEGSVDLHFECTKQ